MRSLFDLYCHGTCTLTIVLLTVAMPMGCRQATPIPISEKQYDKPLPPGDQALVQVTDPDQWPDIQRAVNATNQAYLNALQRSIQWFDYPSSTEFFPMLGITHAQARLSARAMHQILSTSPNAQIAAQRIREDFDCYQSVGCDNAGTVLFTGYYSPVFRASKKQHGIYQYPIYRAPAGLEKDPVTGKLKGTLPDRQTLLATGRLKGRELAWLPSKFDAYIIQVNGSSQLILDDGQIMYVGYEASNEQPYVSVAKALKKDGHIKPYQGLPAMKAFFEDHPEQVDYYLDKNPRFIFLTEYPKGNWPAGNLGFPVTSHVSLATDKSIFPRGGVVLVDTTLPSVRDGVRPFYRLMLDQDTGGAIRAPGRADIYLGEGKKAEQIAGRQAAEGRLYYLFLKPDRIHHYDP